MERLADCAGPTVALIAAPAGYGKTLLLAEWERIESRPFVRARDRRRRQRRGVLTLRLARAHEELDAERPFVLALDDVQRLWSPAALAVLRELVESIPSGSRLALSTRAEPELPIGRLRAHRALLEVRTRDLAMTIDEARRLMEGEGLRLPAHALAALVQRTEGWPAGLYLATIALLDDRDSAAGAEAFRGDEATVADYLRDVAFAGLTADETTFLMRASVLDQLSGPVCDAVLEPVRVGARPRADRAYQPPSRRWRPRRRRLSLPSAAGRHAPRRAAPPRAGERGRPAPARGRVVRRARRSRARHRPGDRGRRDAASGGTDLGEHGRVRVEGPDRDGPRLARAVQRRRGRRSPAADPDGRPQSPRGGRARRSPALGGDGPADARAGSRRLEPPHARGGRRAHARGRRLRRARDAWGGTPRAPTRYGPRTVAGGRTAACSRASPST